MKNINIILILFVVGVKYYLVFKSSNIAFYLFFNMVTTILMPFNSLFIN